MKIQIVDTAPLRMPINPPFHMAGLRLAEKPAPQPDLPEFAFTPKVTYLSRAFACMRCQRAIHEERGQRNHHYITDETGESGPFCPPCAEWAHMYLRTHTTIFSGIAHSRHNSVRTMPLRIVGTKGESMPARLPFTTAARAHKGNADPIWDTGFRLKFAKPPAPDAPLVQPKGTARVQHPLDRYLDRVEEIAWLKSTQHLELATTRQEMLANKIDHLSIDHVPHEVLGAHADAQASGDALPMVIRLPDEPNGTPRYGTLSFIQNMLRRIEWERWRYLNGPLSRTGFVDAGGVLGIAAHKRGATAEELLALKRDHKHQWLAKFGSLPEDANTIAQRRVEVAGVRILDLYPEVKEAYDQSRHDPDEDKDPGRVHFHTVEDPEPGRWQYPFGDCRHCDFSDPDWPCHHGCKILGDSLFAEFHARWKHRQTDIGYAGPRGQLGVDETTHWFEEPKWTGDYDEFEFE